MTALRNVDPTSSQNVRIHTPLYKPALIHEMRCTVHYKSHANAFQNL